MPAEDESIMLSTIQHYVFCPRQAFLIQRLGLFRDDARTAAGSIAHASVDRRKVTRTSDGFRLSRAYVYSDRHNFYGIPDTIEMDALRRPSEIVAVENKIGGLAKASKLQVVGAAIALAEMFPRATVSARLFSYSTRNREYVSVDAHKDEFMSTLRKVREMDISTSPRKDSVAKCSGCSMRFDCLPPALEGRM